MAVFGRCRAGSPESIKNIKKLLAAADDQRRGDIDGRGNLSDQALADFCVFFLQQARDQIRFIRELLHIDGLQERMLAYLAQEANERRIPKSSPDLIHHALLRGRLDRGDALKLLGPVDRTARQHLSKLLDLGLLAPDGVSHRAAVRWNVPVSAGTHYFPQLYPQVTGQELESVGSSSFIQLLRALSEDALNTAIDDMLSKKIHVLANDESVSSAIAETNATGFHTDDYHVDDIDLFDDNDVRVNFIFHLSDEHDPENGRMFSGDEIIGKGVLVINAQGHSSFEDIHADRFL